MSSSSALNGHQQVEQRATSQTPSSHQDAFPFFYNATVVEGDSVMTDEERSILDERRRQIEAYCPPFTTGMDPNPVSGEELRIPMSTRANIVFIGPTGTGKSSLIGSLCRSVTQQEHFPDKIRQTLNHPDSGHGTLHWLESPLNTVGNIVLQDTRGDQSFDAGERTLHDRALQGFYPDGTLMGNVAPLSKDWWKQRWFWQRGSLSESPHCVVFVFDGSVEPFLDGESLVHYKELFKLCTDYGYEPVIVITCADLMHQQAQDRGENFHVKKSRKLDRILFEFERQNLTRQSIYLVTNFHEGKRGRRMWTASDEGFQVANKIFVDLARDLVNICDRYIKRKHSVSRSACSVV